MGVHTTVTAGQIIWLRDSRLRAILALLAATHFFGPVDAALSQGVEATDGRFTVDGEPFFARCIGFETHTRPGQVPWIYEFDAGLISLDLERIKSAGFNTVRTWGALTEEELVLVQNSGLKILFGIWIDPHGDYGSPAFVSDALDHVRDVVSYSKNYDSIIGYIIMNEPLAEHIHDAGAGALVTLWTSAIDIIGAAHPGVPVSVSNTIVGDFIRTDLFGFAAYNAYVYNPVTVTYTHGYSGFVEFLKTKRSPTKPLVITEFGLSVSPGPYSDEYGYGGNTLEQQAEGDLFMYRSLIEGGAQGGCVFQYHDGWWKGGDESTHDASPEEWFGLYHFDGSEPWLGTPRPVWSALEEYNRAIITSPRSGQVYERVVPVELFSGGAATSVRIKAGEQLLVDSPVRTGFNTHEITLSDTSPARDYTLDFVFLGPNQDTVKTESVDVLAVQAAIELPSVTVSVSPDTLRPGLTHSMTVQVQRDSLFTVESNLIDYGVHPHVGFSPGVHRTASWPAGSPSWVVTDNFFVGSDAHVATFGAGVTIRRGSFTKRIYDQHILTDGAWADPILAFESSTGTSAQVAERFEIWNWPNPFAGSTLIGFVLSHSARTRISVFDVLGREIRRILDRPLEAGRHTVDFDASDLPSGVYYYRIESGRRSEAKSMVVAN